jgi:hypothetical protein
MGVAAPVEAAIPVELVDGVAAEVVTASAVAGDNNDDLATPADVIHPNIHQNNDAKQNANPNGANDGGGNIHGIANVPGQEGTNPNDDGVAGFANELKSVHGGIDSVNKNAVEATAADAALVSLAAAEAGTNNDDLATPADVIHPDIHQNNNAGNNANPNGNNNPNGNGGNIHGIANVPGQDGVNPNDDGVAGFANELTTVHGGINSVNKNA